MLRKRNPGRHTYRAPLVAICLFILFALAIVVLSWVPPKSGHTSPTNSTNSTIPTTTAALTPPSSCSSKPVNTYAVFGTSLGVFVLTGALWQLMKRRFTRDEEESENITETGHAPRLTAII